MNNRKSDFGAAPAPRTTARRPSRPITPKSSSGSASVPDPNSKPLPLKEALAQLKELVVSMGALLGDSDPDQAGPDDLRGIVTALQAHNKALGESVEERKVLEAKLEESIADLEAERERGEEARVAEATRSAVAMHKVAAALGVAGAKPDQDASQTVSAVLDEIVKARKELSALQASIAQLPSAPRLGAKEGGALSDELRALTAASASVASKGVAPLLELKKDADRLELLIPQFPNAAQAGQDAPPLQRLDRMVLELISTNKELEKKMDLLAKADEATITALLHAWPLRVDDKAHAHVALCQDLTAAVRASQQLRVAASTGNSRLSFAPVAEGLSPAGVMEKAGETLGNLVRRVDELERDADGLRAEAQHERTLAHEAALRAKDAEVRLGQARERIDELESAPPPSKAAVAAAAGGAHGKSGIGRPAGSRAVAPHKPAQQAPSRAVPKHKTAAELAQESRGHRGQAGGDDIDGMLKKMEARVSMRMFEYESKLESRLVEEMIAQVQAIVGTSPEPGQDRVEFLAHIVDRLAKRSEVENMLIQDLYAMITRRAPEVVVQLPGGSIPVEKLAVALTALVDKFLEYRDAPRGYADDEGQGGGGGGQSALAGSIDELTALLDKVEADNMDKDAKIRVTEEHVSSLLAMFRGWKYNMVREEEGMDMLDTLEAHTKGLLLFAESIAKHLEEHDARQSTRQKREEELAKLISDSLGLSPRSRPGDSFAQLEQVIEEWLESRSDKGGEKFAQPLKPGQAAGVRARVAGKK